MIKKILEEAILACVISAILEESITTQVGLRSGTGQAMDTL